MFASRSTLSGLVPKSSLMHPTYPARHALNKLQHQHMVRAMATNSARHFSTKFRQAHSQLFRQGSNNLNSLKSHVLKYQQRSQSYYIPGATSSNQALYLAGGAAGLIAGYLLLNAVLNNAQAGESYSPAVQRYLRGTYAYLLGASSITAASAVMFWRSGIVMRIAHQHPMAWMILSSLACIGTLYACRTVDPRNVALKHSLFAGFTILEGATLSIFGALGGAALQKAGVYTMAIFLAMSFVAFNAKNERFLYLGGALYSGLAVMIVASLSSLGLTFFGKMPRVTAALDIFVLWGGLALFTAFLLYHTQHIVVNAKQHAAIESSGKMAATLSERRVATRGPDYINESLLLYMDLINIFIRLAIIFSGNNRRR